MSARAFDSIVGVGAALSGRKSFPSTCDDVKNLFEASAVSGSNPPMPEADPTLPVMELVGVFEMGPLAKIENCSAPP
eukprot:CAMPEP_0179840978 /NCGR_PEP_ID=MMETSP0982-20121206/2243_1 /TAXON_ID=483367 /ORGANISM="non described non described, Strain CCMP 2436" /LENGTH=76 /DNA_ID=CAMNT_0021724943 /DNA_START=62 /DNA_END=288 /DNA_ORIENTATION=+